MSDQNAILAVLVLAGIFVVLWVFTNRQKRRFEEERRERRKELKRIKTKARQKNGE